MITPRKTTSTKIEWRFKFPLSARDIIDAVNLVEKERNSYGDGFDDRYWVTADDEELIFSWGERS